MTSAHPASDVAAALEAAVRSGAMHAGAVGLITNGRVTTLKAAGDLYPGGPEADVASLFGIGSITELLTAVAAVRAGVDLSSPVSTYLPELTVGGVGTEDIRIEHLLSHSSGLPYARRASGPTDNESLERYVDSDIRFHRTLVRPGQLAIQTPSGFNLVGRVLEVVVGAPFDRILQDLALDPAGMTTATYPSGADDRRVVWPISEVGDSGKRPSSLLDDLSGHPSGFLYASLQDLIALATAILEGYLVDESAWVEMTRQRTSRRIDHISYPLALTGAGYGVGCQVGVWNDQPVVRHPGVESSYRCTVELLPESASAAVILTNACDGPTFNDLLNRCYEALAGRGRLAAEPNLAALDDSIRRSWAGTYVQPSSGRRIDVEDVEGDLVFRDEQVEAPLYYVGGSRATAPMGYGSAPIWFPTEEGPAPYLTVWGEAYFRETVAAWEPSDPNQFGGTFRDGFWPRKVTDVTVTNKSGNWVVSQGDDSFQGEGLGERRLVTERGVVELSEDAMTLQVGNATVYHRS